MNIILNFNNYKCFNLKLYLFCSWSLLMVRLILLKHFCFNDIYFLILVIIKEIYFYWWQCCRQHKLTNSFSSIKILLKANIKFVKTYHLRKNILMKEIVSTYKEIKNYKLKLWLICAWLLYNKGTLLNFACYRIVCFDIIHQ